MCSVGLFLTANSTAPCVVRPPLESCACAGRVSATQIASAAIVRNWLLMTERLDGIQLRRFARGQVAEKYSDERRKGERQDHDFRRDHERQGQRTRGEKRADQP